MNRKSLLLEAREVGQNERQRNQRIRSLKTQMLENERLVQHISHGQRHRTEEGELEQFEKKQ
jgi:hypothetical protein